MASHRPGQYARAMPEGVEDYHARVEAALGPDRRLALVAAEIPNWDIFPFEAGQLRLKPLQPLAAAEEPRHGEGGRPCQCTDPFARQEGLAWEDEHWRLTALGPSGAPLVAMLVPREHHDLGDLPDERAAELGRLIVHLAAAVEALPSVGRVHVSRWGDGGAHLHVFFIARPARMPQLRGTCMALWDDFLPPLPVAVRDENLAFVVDRLVRSYGGAAAGPGPAE